jgi:acetyl esterase/lipase
MLITLLGCAATRGATPTESDLAYAQTVPTEPTAHLLDIYLPPTREEGPLPVLVFVHGGSWRLFDKQAAHARNPSWVLAHHGVAVVTINHRKKDVRHPAHVDDVARAIAWVHEHAHEYGFDRAAVFVGGMSSGGHLAALVGVDPKYLERAGASSESLAGVVAISGVYDLDARTRGGRPLGRRTLAKSFGDDRAAYPEASPMHSIHRPSPRFLLVSARWDPRFMRVQAEQFRDELENNAVWVRHIETPGNHLSITGKIARQANNPALAAILEFIRGSR